MSEDISELLKSAELGVLHARYHDALSRFTRISQFRGISSEAFFYVKYQAGTMYCQIGDFKSAQKVFEALEKKEGEGEYLGAIGQCQVLRLKTGKSKEGQRDFERPLEYLNRLLRTKQLSDLVYVFAQNEKGNVLFDKKKGAYSRKAYERALKRNAKFWLAQLNLATLLWEESAPIDSKIQLNYEQMQKIEAEYKKVIKIAPECVEAYWAICAMYAKQKAFAKAKQPLAEVLKRNSDFEPFTRDVHLFNNEQKKQLGLTPEGKLKPLPKSAGVSLISAPKTEFKPFILK